MVPKRAWLVRENLEVNPEVGHLLMKSFRKRKMKSEMMRRELDALLLFCFYCSATISVLCLFFAIVAFPCHTHLLYEPVLDKTNIFN